VGNRYVFHLLKSEESSTLIVS